MAVSNTIGSNVFDILVGLGIPWGLQTMVINYGSTVSSSHCPISQMDARHEHFMGNDSGLGPVPAKNSRGCAAPFPLAPWHPLSLKASGTAGGAAVGEKPMCSPRVLSTHRDGHPTLQPAGVRVPSKSFPSQAGPRPKPTFG